MARKEEFPIQELKLIRRRLQSERLTKNDIAKLRKLVLNLESSARAIRAAIVK